MGIIGQGMNRISRGLGIAPITAADVRPANNQFPDLARRATPSIRAHHAHFDISQRETDRTRLAAHIFRRQATLSRASAARTLRFY